jgi:hypothetical protein
MTTCDHSVRKRDRRAKPVAWRFLKNSMQRMTWVAAMVSAWWIVGLGTIASVVVGVVLWRWVLADLVFATIELP